MIKWTELRVVDSDELDQGTLGEFVNNPEKRPFLDNATIDGDRIESWPDFWLCARDEDPDDDTPRCDVDWSGFIAYLKPGNLRWIKSLINTMKYRV